VHSLSQKGAEGFAASTRAAAAGGVTTIVDMPYDEGNLVCSAEAVRRKVAMIDAEARIDVALYGTVDPQEGSARIAEQAAAGVCAYKFSTFGTDPQRFPRIPPALLRACFAEIAKTGLAAGVHNEDDAYVRAAISEVEASGITDWRAHGLSRPRTGRDAGDAADLRNRRRDGLSGACRPLLRQPRLRNRRDVSQERPVFLHRMLHSLPCSG
jgi:allantoinase